MPDGTVTITHRPVRVRLHQALVLEHHDASNEVEALRMQIPHQRREVAHGRPLRTQARRRPGCARMRQHRRVALHVDHQGVELGGGREPQRGAAQARVRDAVGRQVQRLGPYGLQGDAQRGRLQLRIVHPDTAVADGARGQRLLGAVG